MASAKRTIELRELRRLALWGASAAAAVALTVFVLLNGPGQHRLGRTAPQGVEAARPGSPSAAPVAAAQSSDDRQSERLKGTVHELTAERERLLERIGSLEQALEDITGSIARAQPHDPDVRVSDSQPVAAVPASVPAPSTFTPSGLALASAIPYSAQPAPRVPVAATSAPASEATAESPAEGEFGLDLGRSATVEGLRSLWATIRSRHGSMLEGLKPIVYVRPGDGSGRIELRLIAGPVSGPAAAAKLCAALTAAAATCRPTAWDGQRLALQ